MGSYSIDSAQLNEVLHKMSQAAAARAANKYRERIREEIMLSGRIDTGDMFNEIQIETPPRDIKKGRARVRFMMPYFKFQDLGTKGSTARPGSALRFRPKGSAIFIFRKKTGPIPPAHFRMKAAEKMQPRDWVD